ncbi:MAG TPA: winged helix-turn-helix domain-containing protein [Nitrososphaera sp.]
MKYRSRADICTEILKIADNDVSKTKIMYGAYLCSYTAEYLKMLHDDGMQAFDEETMQFKTIERGRNFIKTYEQIGPKFGGRKISSEKG